VDWIDLAQDRDQWNALVNTVMKLQIPQNTGKFLNICTTGGSKKDSAPWSSIIRIARPGEVRNAYDVVVGRPQRKAPRTVAVRVTSRLKISVNYVRVRTGCSW
jgi:hypothetical protein